MADARAYWDQFYEKAPFRQGKAPSPFLVEMLPRLAKGKVLDVAMGEGRNAVYLAQKGFQVKGFDISKVAITHAEKLARETGVAIEAKTGDLDLMPLGLLEYDTIVMFDFKPVVARYYTEIIRALKQGGTLLVESSTVEDMKELIPTGEEFRDYYYKSNELLRALQGMRILYYNEALIDGRHVVQCLALKPLDKDAVKYGLFDMHSKQKSKEKSAQLELAEAFFKKRD